MFMSLLSETKVSPQILSAFQVLKEMVEDALSHSAYATIDLSKLFRFFTLEPADKLLKAEPIEIDILPETEQIDALLELGTF